MKVLPVLCALLISGAAESATRYVDPSHLQSTNSGVGDANKPYKTITHAMSQLASGDAASADELVAVNDFGSDVSTTNGTLTLNASTVRIQN